ncbi:MAG: hypothetical protein GY816_22640 [Cytophagales bacterium]|nr:hypothetical protein [Cytophagales bacterium]
MKKLAGIVFLIILFSTHSFSQDISGNQNWKIPQDYKEVEAKIVKNIQWLENNPLIENEESKEVARYVMKWVLGCPHLTVKLDGYIIPILQQSNYEYVDDLQGIYLFGKMLYLINNQGIETSEIDSMVRGIVGILNAYTAIKNIKGDVASNETLEKFKELNEEGELKKHIQDMVQKSWETH